MDSFGTFKLREVGVVLHHVATNFKNMKESDLPGIFANKEYLCANRLSEDFLDDYIKPNPNYVQQATRDLAIGFSQDIDSSMAMKLSAMVPFCEILKLDPILAQSDLKFVVPND